MPSINKIIGACKKIKENYGVYNRKDILANYLLLSIKKSILSKKKQRTIPGARNILGFKIDYLSFNTFFVLYNEIFIELEYYFKTNSSQPFIIDCGSNMGMSILFYKYIYPDAEIIGFEPDIYAYETLSKNVLQNNLSNTTVIQKALSDKDGEIEFYYDPENTSSLQMSILEARESKSKVTVNCTLLSQYINKTVDFLKLDIEGAESLVIKDLDKQKKLQHIQKMMIEYHHHINKDEDKLSEIINILEKNNFGYQIKSRINTPYPSYCMQDIMIYAYQK